MIYNYTYIYFFLLAIFRRHHQHFKRRKTSSAMEGQPQSTFGGNNLNVPSLGSTGGGPIGERNRRVSVQPEDVGLQVIHIFHILFSIPRYRNEIFL